MDGSASLLQMVLSLAAVVAVILGLAWMTRRMQGLRATQGSELLVRATLAVGMKERVVLIEAAGQQFLIGVAPGRVSLISAIDSAAVTPGADARTTGTIAPGDTASGMPLSSAFAHQLNKLLGR